MTSLKRNQEGLVAIVVSMMLIIIITLVVVSFAFFMRREQQQILDRQLSTQAFFAAESGVNDYVAKLINGETHDSSDCANLDPFPVGDSNAAYSCVIVDSSVTSLEYSDLSADRSQLVRLRADQPINKIFISWESVDSKDFFATNDKYFLPTQSFADRSDIDTFSEHIAMLGLMVIPLDTSPSRSEISDSAKAFFAYPAQDPSLASAVSYRVADADGAFISGKCEISPTDGRTNQCIATITDIVASSDEDASGLTVTPEVVLRIRPIYQNAKVTITAESNFGPVTFLGAQAEIDSTGRANDVLRRIQVRVPLQGDGSYFPEYVLESGDDICKRLQLQDSSGTSLDACPTSP